MDQNKNKTPGEYEIGFEELEKATGGWEYTGPVKWLKGYNVACPYCGSGSQDDVEFQYAGGLSRAYFKCKCCNRQFSYRYLSDKVWRFDDQSRGI